VQSGRYTSQRIVDVVDAKRGVEEVFYLRPVGTYRDRSGKSYVYTETMRRVDAYACLTAAQHFKDRLADGMAEEHARDMIPYAVRQHFIVSFNLRSVMHFMDLRAKKDAQLEIRQLCELVWPHVAQWAPEVAKWYEDTRMFRARLAP
jgi:thymidylate synthase (FAD)